MSCLDITHSQSSAFTGIWVACKVPLEIDLQKLFFFQCFISINSVQTNFLMIRRLLPQNFNKNGKNQSNSALKRKKSCRVKKDSGCVIFCPMSSNFVCSSNDQCLNHGECVDATCICTDLYYGDQCQTFFGQGDGK